MQIDVEADSATMLDLTTRVLLVVVNSTQDARAGPQSALSVVMKCTAPSCEYLLHLPFQGRHRRTRGKRTSPAHPIVDTSAWRGEPLLRPRKACVA